MEEERLAEFRRVGCVAWSSDGTGLAAGDNYGVVARHALVDGAFVSRGVVRVSPRDAPVAALCAPTPELVAAATADGTIALLPWTSVSAPGDEPVLHTLATGRTLGALCVAQSAGSAPWLVVAPQPTAFDVATLRECARLGDDSRTATVVCAVGDGHRVATGGLDGALRLWDLRAPQTPTAVLRAPGTPSPCCCIAANADGRLLAGASEDGDVLVWHTGAQTLVAHTGNENSAPAVDIAFAHDGTLLCALLGARGFVAYALSGTRSDDAHPELPHVGLLREAFRSTDAGADDILALCERSCSDACAADPSGAMPVRLPPRPLRAVGCADGTVAVFDGPSRVVSLPWPRG